MQPDCSADQVDIIENINAATSNQVTLHTGPGCTINGGGFTGALISEACDSALQSSQQNTGCGITTTDTLTYGSSFNTNGGGVYATEITSGWIAVYFFPRGSIPSDITSGSPDPAGWSEPLARFEGSCDIAANFTNLQIVIDTGFCGAWAGGQWSTSSCGLLASSCENFVAQNPSAFVDAYWSINALKVYSSAGDGSQLPHTATSDSSNGSTTAVPQQSTSYSVIATLSTSSTPVHSDIPVEEPITVMIPQSSTAPVLIAESTTVINPIAVRSNEGPQQVHIRKHLQKLKGGPRH